MQGSASSEMGRVGDGKLPRRESWHAGQTSTPPESEDAEALHSSTSKSTARLRRRSTSAQVKYKAGALQPPKLPELRDTDDEFRVSCASSCLPVKPSIDMRGELTEFAERTEPC